MSTKLGNRGFTLVELMITIAMAGIIVAAVYSMHIIQQKTYASQDQVTAMQQNIRAAVYSMVSELRMAGYDPTFSSSASITAASVATFRFTADLDEDGVNTGTNETITYALSGDADNNGVADSGSSQLTRDTGSGAQPLAENIEAIEFLYTMEDGTRTTTPTTQQITQKQIRAVTISILARTGFADTKFRNNTRYRSASGVIWDLNGSDPGTGNPTRDNYRRRLLTTTVKCRNMGV